MDVEVTRSRESRLDENEASCHPPIRSARGLARAAGRPS